MGRSSIFRIAIFALWVIAATSFTPSTRDAIASFRTRSGGNCDERIVHYDPLRSSVWFAKDETKASEQKMEVERIPNIQELRNKLRKWSKMSVPDAPTEATKVLKTMFRYYRTNPGGENFSDSENRRRRIRAIVDAIDCTQVINSWSKSRRHDAPKQALAILKEMIEVFQQDGNSCIRPDSVTYNSVMNAFARRGDFEGASAVFSMQTNDFKEQGNTMAKPDAYTFSTMINACSRSNRRGVTEAAGKLLATMNDWHARGDLEQGPSIVTYNAVIHCFSKSNTPDAPDRTRTILETMISRYNNEGSKNTDDDNVVRPNAITYNSVLNAHARQGDVKGATEIFEMMKKDFESGNAAAKPQVQSYNILIDAWSKSNEANAPQEAESLLDEIVRMQSEGKFEQDEGPDIMTYSAVINCYSKSKLQDAPARARKLLETMIFEYENGGKKDNVRPDKVVYGAVMNAHARQGDTKGATEVFEMMTKDFHSGNKNAEPNVPSYNILIDAWSKSNKEHAPKRAELLMKEVTKKHADGVLKEGPDAITYGAVINCYSKSNLPDAPRRARDLLETMIAQCEGDDTKKDVRPNTITYAAVMDAHARQGDVEGATEVFEMLKQDRNCEPNVQTYTILIDAWSKSNNEDAPLQAALLLREMVGMGTASRQDLKKGHSKTTTLQQDSLSRARGILQEMHARYDRWDKTFHPDIVTYNAVMNAFAKQGDVEGATDVFEMMEQDYKSGTNRNARLDVRTYNILLDAWAKSGDEKAPAESEEILNEMNRRCDNGELYKRPDAVTYRTMIQCLELFDGTDDRIEELKTIMSSMS